MFVLFTFKASSDVQITDGCAETTLGDGAQRNPEIPSMSWVQTPSIVDMGISKPRVKKPNIASSFHCFSSFFNTYLCFFCKFVARTWQL